MANFTINLTHDVDRVRKTYQYVTHDLMRAKFSKLRGLWAMPDPYWQFERLMDLEDCYGVRSTFFFLEESIRPEPLRPASWKLAFGRYSLREPAVGSIIRMLDAGGWEVGLHGSYRSFRQLDLLQREKAVLEDVLGKPVLGNRQHYLNLDVPETWKLHRAAGFKYDASFGLKRGIGWRDGLYHPFRDEASGMVVIPLTLMERNLFSQSRSQEEIWMRCEHLMDEAEREGAIFSVLWHQRIFNQREFPGYATIYEQIIEEGKRRGADFLTCHDIYEQYTKHGRYQPAYSDGSGT